MNNAERLVVVTGGAGFIGSHLVDRLLAEGRRVRVLDDFSQGSHDNLADSTAAHGDRLEVVEADVRDADTMQAQLVGVDTVYHLATRNVRLSLRRPTEVHEVNSVGTYRVLQAAATNRVRRFLYCSSSEVNGTADPDALPMKEEYNYRPETIYGASKLTGEYYTLVFHRAGWLKATVARPHNNYGPRSHFSGHSGEAIPRFIMQALNGLSLRVYGDGAQTRDFTWVRDTADFLVQLANTDAALGTVVNVCTGRELPVRDLARRIVELTESRSEVMHVGARPSDVLRLCGDTTRLQQVCGRVPSVTLDQGLRETIHWFRERYPASESVLAQLRDENWEPLEPEGWMPT